MKDTFIGTISPFDLKQFLMVNEVLESKRAAVSFPVMGDEHFQLLTNLVVLKNPTTMSFDECGSRGCSGKLYTNLDASEVIRTGEHAEGCRVDAHAFYHQQQLNELKRLAAGDPRPVLEIYDELASNASTSLETAAYFPTWEQARNTMYYSRSKRYPRLPASRQDLRLTAEQTTTKSGAQFLMYHSPTNDILIFATEDGVKLLAQSNC
ncbi:hypothetical protein T08_452 [Trichinella sp. T8]|nr:hypothetical protein T08_452 [Trichinella sp. T8]